MLTWFARSTVAIGAAALTAVGSGVSASAQVPYVAMCSWLEGPGAAAYRARWMAANSGLPSAASIASSVASLFPEDDVSVVVRNFERNRSHPTVVGPEHDTVQIRRAGAGTRFVEVAVDRDGRAHNPKSTGDPKTSSSYVLARYMASYIYFNEMMEDDRTSHRASCAETMRNQFYDLPSFAEEASSALAGEPFPDPGLARRIRAAYARFVGGLPDLTGVVHDLTKDTLAKLGSDPPIAIVYRDHDATTRAEHDVVRIGTAARHTYAIFDVGLSGEDRLGPAPLCLTGDVRCSTFYNWP